MDTLPLPPRPDLAQYRKRAKELVAAVRSTDPGAVPAWAREWLEALARLRGVAITQFVQASLDRAVEGIEAGVRERLAQPGAGAGFVLADAQFLLARAHGFAGWPEFSAHVGQITQRGAGVDLFETAADAVVGGDLATLAALVQQHPSLINARSTRVHRATLLHYVAANGVEDFRQRTPPNAVAIARCLLAAGAAVDALAETYGGGTAQTTMNLLVSSTHPAAAGVQVALAETLLDFGAAIDGLDQDGSPLMTAVAFGYLDVAEALARRGAKVDSVLAAAALGRADLVGRLLADAGQMKRSLVGIPWLGLSSDPASHVRLAFVWACAFGRTPVVDLLLAHGVDPAAADSQGMTGLHWAAANGHGEIVERLLARGAPLEAKNQWGGTVLGCTVYFARQHPEDVAYYVARIERLLSAGADVHAVARPTGDQALDAVLQRHGARWG